MKRTSLEPCSDQSGCFGTALVLLRSWRERLDYFRRFTLCAQAINRSSQSARSKTLRFFSRRAVIILAESQFSIVRRPTPNHRASSCFSISTRLDPVPVEECAFIIHYVQIRECCCHFFTRAHSRSRHSLTDSGSTSAVLNLEPDVDSANDAISSAFVPASPKPPQGEDCVAPHNRARDGIIDRGLGRPKPRQDLRGAISDRDCRYKVELRFCIHFKDTFSFGIGWILRI